VQLVREGESGYPPITWVNPGAETGDLTGWTVTVGVPGVIARPATATSGTRSFWGGQSALTKMYQDLVIPGGDWPAQVDAGNVRFTVDSYQGYYQMAFPDAASMTIYALDADDNVLATGPTATPTTGTFTYPSGSSMRWRGMQSTRVLPALTRKVRVELISTRSTGTNNDGGHDDVIPTLELVS
jgi:hypothetical protein